MRARSVLARVVVCVCIATSGTARAGDPWEAWPELSVFVGLTPQTRLYLDTAYTWAEEGMSTALDVAAYVDISLKPILRPTLLTADWQRSRYLWARVGYDHVQQWSDGERGDSEHRGILSLLGKVELPARFWLESRLRTDLRSIGGDTSARHRVRLEATRELLVSGHVIVPYANLEAMYDTRYDGWARALAQVGAEVTMTGHFRVELYVARQADRLPKSSRRNAFGIVAKWFF